MSTNNTSNTSIIHAVPVDPLTGSISVPIYQTATFVQEAPGVNKGYDYGRSGNPTRQALERLVAGLENGSHAYAFATGLAAIDAVVKLLGAGDEIIAVDDIYGGAYRLLTQVYEKFGIKVHYVDTSDLEAISERINGKTKFIWLESPTNPTLKISDIAAIASLIGSKGIKLVVDNTFATPVAQQPLNVGADIVIHSGTKYLGGHSDLVAGLVVVKEESLAEQVKFIQNATGAILGPNDCWLLIRGIETLNLRFRHQSATALQVACFLQDHPAIDTVYYPGLSTHAHHDIATVQQNGLFGAVISFTLKEDAITIANEIVCSTRYFKLAESLGGVKSLICSPPQMTHKSIPREKRLQAGIKDSLIRISIGIEEATDLIADLEQALGKAFNQNAGTATLAVALA
ncbi:MAG: PLP-dependent transferase [Flavobacterium sp.]|nr:MAG: PLP-dependent transferase [Flavobacterium sp.]